jgi:serine/threonine-protein kinase RsbW
VGPTTKFRVILENPKTCFSLFLPQITEMLIGSFNLEFNPKKLILESNLESINILENLIKSVKEENTISEESFTGIWIALNEAVTNAIKHGNKYDPCKKVSLEVEQKEGRYICFTVKDEGNGFDHTILPDPTHPDNIEELNGRGVYLINKLADRVSFSANGTIVEMCFDLFKN